MPFCSRCMELKNATEHQLGNTWGHLAALDGFQVVQQNCSCGLIDDSSDLKIGNFTSFPGGLLLSSGEVCRHSDHCPGNGPWLPWSAQIVFPPPLSSYAG